ncbi:NAD(+) synthase [Janibacter hoylei]
MAENTAFDSLYAHGFARVAAVTLPVAIADPVTNASRIVAAARQAHARGVAVAVFPELALTGYAIDDLLLQDALLETVHAQIRRIAADSEGLTPVLVFGAPIRHRNRLFNCAVVVKDGEVLGVAPKTYLPNYREFYEKRHFASGVGLEGEYLTLPGLRRAQQDQASAGPDGFEDDFEDELADEIEVPFGPDLIFRATDLPDLALHVEICEDMWVPVPPSARASLAGATLLVNLSGSPITIGRAEDRRQLVASASARCLAGYVYAAAGQGESTTDLAWDGQTMIYELGTLLAEGERFAAPHGERPTLTVADVDLGRITQERLRQGSFDDNARALEIGDGEFTEISFELEPPTDDLGLLRKVDRFPFVPDDPARLAQDCYEAYHIQVAGLEQRLRAIGTPKAVIGVSGGLDSTHALIVACKAMDRLGRPRSDVLAFTMPGFATGETSKGYATRLSQLLGVTFAELDIRPTATQMLKDMGHPFGDGEPVYDVTFENVQAGLRYDYLFRLANQRGGIVARGGPHRHRRGRHLRRRRAGQAAPRPLPRRGAASRGRPGRLPRVRGRAEWHHRGPGGRLRRARRDDDERGRRPLGRRPRGELARRRDLRGRGRSGAGQPALTPFALAPVDQAPACGGAVASAPPVPRSRST